jgi:hypothetical protein
MFVGEDRERILSSLIAEFTGLPVEGGARMVVLESLPGWGKTRIVQELYAHVAAAQAPPAYWPPLLFDPSESDPERRRKRVYPAVVHVPDGASLPWLWWGISCQRRQSGEFAQVLADDITQLEQHGEAIIRAKLRRERATKTLVDLLVSVAGQVLPPVGLAADAKEAGENLIELWRARQKADQGERVVHAGDERRPDLVTRIIELVDLLGRDVPLVVVVDDAHDADPGVVDLLKRLPVEAPSAAVLVACTAWPDRLREQAEAGEEGSFGLWLSEAVTDGSAWVRRVELDRLGEGDVEKVVRAHAPATEPAVLEALAVRADGNPLVAESLLQLRRVTRRLRNGRLELTVAEIDALPASYPDILRERWRDLPESVQEALCVASLQGVDFLTELVAESYDALSLEGDPVESIEAAASPYAWIRRLGQVMRFQELYNLDIARGERPRLLDEDEAAEARTRIADRIERWRADEEAWKRIDQSTRHALLRLHVDLAEEGVAAALAPAADSAFALSAELLSAGDYRSALRYARASLDLARGGRDEDRRSVGYRRLLLGQALGYMGRFEDASIEFETVVGEFEELFGPSAPETEEARASLALARSDLGELDEALELTMRVLEAREERFGRESPETARTRGNLASILEGLGRFEEAYKELESARQAFEEALGTDSEEAVMARANLASLLKRMGYYGEAYDIEREVLATRERVLGKEHPETIGTRGSLANSLYELGQLEEALAIGQRVVEEYARLLGDEHPATVTARINLAITLGDLDRAQDALEILREAVPALERSTSPSDPDLAWGRALLASALRKAGETEESLSVSERMVADAVDRLGAGHPDTLAARGQLAAALLDADRPGDALRELELAVTDSETAIGADHPDTLNRRFGVAVALFNLDRGDEARAYLADLERDATRSLGSDDPLTVQVRNALRENDS